MAPRTTSAVAAFLAKLPADRHEEFARVRDVVRRHLPKGYEEVVEGRMIVWQVPFKLYSDTYNGRPLWYAALSDGKARFSLHLLGIYWSKALTKKVTDGFKALGRKPDMGKGCIRFRTADELPLGAIGEVVAALPMKEWIAVAEAQFRR